MQINEAIAKLSTPAQNIYGQYLHLLCDRHGKILEVFVRSGGWHGTFHYKELVDRIKQNENIIMSFNVPPVKDLNDLESYDGRQNYSNKEIITFIGHPWNFKTNLPHVYLRLYKIDNNNFLGIVSPSGIMPSPDRANGNYVIYTDNNDRIRGIDLDLVELYYGHQKKGNLEIGNPTQTLFTQSPDQIREAYIEKMNRRKIRWNSFLSSEHLKEILLAQKGASDSGNGCVNLEKRTEENSIWLLSEVLNLSKSDYRLTIDCEHSLVSTIPLLIFGIGKRSIDNMEYQASVVPEGSKGRRRFLIKRRGTICRLSDVEWNSSGRVKLVFRKSGRAFFLSVDDVEVLRFVEDNPSTDEAAYCGIALREIASLKIYDLQLECATAGDEGEFADVLEMKGHVTRYFTYSRIEHPGLTVNAPDVTATLLTDITAIHERSISLERQYKSEVTRSKKLESKLTVDMRKEAKIIGVSQEAEKIREQADMLAGVSATVLIQGPTGTGKELLARYLHAHSPWASKPMVKVDCSTLPDTLIESELFGHERGAFTGAVETKAGRFEQADGGTLFLDEISNLSLGTQAKLLNFLQDRTVTRIGGVKPIHLNVRIITATNIPLAQLVKEGKMRADLFYRFEGVTINLPPLRERQGDIPLLAEVFLANNNRIYGKEIKSITGAAQQKLLKHEWPGNIRELENVINRAYIFCESESIGIEHIHLTSFENSRPASARTGIHLKGMSKDILEDALTNANGCVADAARKLNMSRVSFYANLKKFGISAENFRAGE
ncbi:MAG: sigma-54-dependent Fis family transcriptional regulator [Fibrobacteres bacterium]|nr:sigma-54-dependent Fis family transcriptional regulator [Fibrobacterota bacterium]